MMLLLLVLQGIQLGPAPTTWSDAIIVSNLRSAPNLQQKLCCDAIILCIFTSALEVSTGEASICSITAHLVFPEVYQEAT